MKSAPFLYQRPETVHQALHLLLHGGPDARVIAGGQSLVPAMNFRLARPSLLVDLGGIETLRGIRLLDDGAVLAGAMTRHSDFEFSDLVRERLPLLHAAMPSIAHMQIRSRGTIGGSLAHADPAADWPALCLACGAELILTKVNERVVPAAEFSTGFFSTALVEGEIISAVRFPVWPRGRRWGFKKMTRRRGDFAIAGIACVVDVSDRGNVDSVRLVVYGATDAPLLLAEAGALIVGSAPSAKNIAAAAKAAALATPVRSDLHASAEYRRELVEVLSRRALEQALPEARSQR